MKSRSTEETLLYVLVGIAFTIYFALLIFIGVMMLLFPG